MTERSWSPLDHRMMGLALREARKGHPSPNPHVGAVIARGNEVIGRGYHARAGEAHAEVAALGNAGRGAKGATLYVSLEPCNHQGRTPPCTEAILAAKLRRLVVGCTDPACHVPGGLDKLRLAGVEVLVGVRAEEAEALIAPWAHHLRTGTPSVTLKAALTLDGKIAARSGDSKWISSLASRRKAHRLRAEHDAILVGVGTVLEDDPLLTTRHCRGPNPLRVILDSRLRSPEGCQLLQSAKSVPTLFYHGPKAPRAKIARIEGCGAECVAIPNAEVGKGLSLRALMLDLGGRGVVRLLAEGGSLLHGSLLEGGMAHYAALFLAPCILGDTEAVGLAHAGEKSTIGDAWRLAKIKRQSIGEDTLITGRFASANAAS